MQSTKMTASNDRQPEWLAWVDSKEALRLLSVYNQQSMGQLNHPATFLNRFRLHEPVPIGLFHALVTIHYMTVFTQDDPNPLDDPADCRVTNIWVFKRNGISQHESVAFAISTRLGGIAHFIVDRNVSLLGDLPGCLSSRGKQARDTIKRVPMHHMWSLGNVVWVATYQGNQGMTILRLSSLLAAISRCSPTYTLFRHNCLWYIGSILRLFHAKLAVQDPQTASFAKRGKWFRYRVDPPAEQELDDINTLALQLFEEIQTKVSNNLRL